MLGGLTGWHALMLIFWVVPFVLWVIALVQVALSRTTAAYVIAWIAVTTLVPLIGPILWFTLGRTNASRNRNAAGAA
ncbi:PLDc N-terminal domain-containing protein [Leifsonia aquatica]|uniref:PLDc N-terminal domain-containing protein n=1 Tax=Leifsonia aquatica TaxID=144185 RepID=UPI0028AF23B5|nr:PLDc N-terminal domain-containing protein [Leifsonia aquatica]